MAIIISCVNQKGGVGKSTLTLNLAAALAELPARVLVVDCDSQQTAVKLIGGATGESPFPAAVISLHSAENKLGELLRPHAENYDFIVIDGPPSHLSKVTRAAVACSDLVLLPTIPAKPDLLATAETAELLKELEQRLDRELNAYVVVNQAERTRIKRMFDGVVADSIPYPVLQTEVRKRTSYRESAAVGGSVLTSGDQEAASDMRALRDEVLSKVHHEGASE
jgi:chromosome partitioning protein